MKQIQINAAYNVMRRLANLQLPVKRAYELYMLIKQIEPMREFAVTRGKALLEKYHGTLKSDGEFVFPTKDDAQAFGKELNELNNMEVDVNVTPVVMSYDDMSEYTLSPAEIASIDGFVTFEE